MQASIVTDCNKTREIKHNRKFHATDVALECFYNYSDDCHFWANDLKMKKITLHNNFACVIFRD